MYLKTDNSVQLLRILLGPSLSKRIKRMFDPLPIRFLENEHLSSFLMIGNQRPDVSDIEVILQPSFDFRVFLKILEVLVVIGRAEVHLLYGMRPDSKKTMIAVLITMM